MIWEKRTTKMRMRMIEVGLMLKIVAGGGVGTLLFLFFALVVAFSKAFFTPCF